MKGVIVMCLGELVTKKFGKEKWQKALKDSELNESSVFLATQDVDDGIVMKVVNNVCKILNISLAQAADAFGEYWMNAFASKIYKAYYKGVKSAKEFLLKMDDVHNETTMNIPNAKPPRFEYEENDNTLIMTYKSERGLIDFFIGLIKGVGIYYKEDIKVTKISETKVEIIFQ